MQNLHITFAVVGYFAGFMSSIFLCNLYYKNALRGLVHDIYGEYQKAVDKVRKEALTNSKGPLM